MRRYAPWAWMPIRFDSLTVADVSLLTRWLQELHVRAFWDDGERDEATVYDHSFAPERDAPGFILRVDGHPTGFLKTERIAEGHEFQPWATPAGETWAIDLLIGEVEQTGRGWGHRLSGRSSTSSRANVQTCTAV